MFLAKTWVTKNGVRYETWVLKKAVWNKEKKRTRQVYLASLGRSKRISLQKATEICKKLSIPLEELRQVRRLKIVDDPAAGRSKRKVAVKQAPPARKEKSPRLAPSEQATLVKELRQRYGLPATPDGFQQLAMRVGVLHVSVRELQITESGHGGLRDEQIKHIEQTFFPKRQS
jgi:hypothetical protein